MDAARFDQVARKLAGAWSRRSFLAGVLASVASVALPRPLMAQTALPCWYANGTPKPAGTTCVDPNNPCILEGHCDGRVPECLPDVVQYIGFPCGSPSAPCEYAPTCAAGGVCAQGALKEEGVVCREADDRCFLPELCTGISSDCAGCTFPTADPNV